MGMGPTKDLGPATATWGSHAIAEIWDEVRWTLTGENAEVFELVFGATPVDTVFLGYSACSVTVPATRITLALLQPLLPGGSISGSGLVVNADIAVGISMYDTGLPLIIKPIVAGVAAVNGTWLRLEHTYPTPNFDVVFNLRDQRVYGLTFKAHPDATNKQLWSAGKVNEAASY